MDRQTSNAFKLYLFFLAMSSIVTFIEYPQIQNDLKINFLLSKLLVFILCASGLVILFLKKRFVFFAHLLAFTSFLIYPALGEMFRPTYEYAILPIFIIAAMFVPFSRKILFPSFFVSTLVFCYVYYIHYERNLLLIKEMNVFDNIWSFITFAITAAYASHVLNFERELRNKAQARYSLIGTQASAILHDLKNILATPLLQIDHLRSVTQENSNPQVAVAISDIEKTLTDAATIAIRFNQMSLLANTDKALVKISDTISEVKAILNRRLNGVKVEIEGDRSLMADQGFITSLFLNLFMNSLSAMEKSGLKKITITIEDKKISFKDTGSGFSDEALKHINKNLTFTDKENGSGNGLRIIKEACLDLGASVKFYNSASGACVDILIS